jgi:6-phosphogluconolactonase (cycloisomerase 2 family)
MLLTSCAAAVLLSACGGGNDSSTTASSPSQATTPPPVVANQLYTQTNEQANAIVHMSRNSDGGLTVQNKTFTGGDGTNGVKFGDTTNTSVGDSLVSQHSITISSDNTMLFAVNAGNNTISTLAINQTNGDLTLEKVNATTGQFPTSLAYSKGTLYVSFEGGSEKVQAYTVNSDGSLTLLGAYAIPANGTNAIVPTQVVVSPNGGYLAVSAGTASGEVVSYPINADGSLGTPVANTSVTTPFAGAFLNNNVYLTTDITDKALTSYNFASGALTANGAFVTSGDAAPCWLVVTPNGQYAYVGNGGNGPIASYGVSSSGALTLLNPLAANNSTKVAGDSWISADGKYLYTAYLADGMVVAYAINADGSLTEVGTPAPISTVSGVSMQGLVGI